MNDILKEKIVKAFKNEKIDYNSLILDENINLSDEEYLFVVINMYENNIDEHRQLNEINYKEIKINDISKSEFLEEMLKEYHNINKNKDFENMNFYEKNEIKINITNLLLKESILNIRYGIEFLDLFHEAYIDYVRLKTEVFDTLNISNEKLLIHIISMFIRRSILLYQKQVIEKYKDERLSHIIYSILKKNENYLKEYNVTKEYFNFLENQYKENILEEDNLVELKEEIEESYEVALNTSKLTYVEEIILLIYLGVELDVLESKKKLKELNISTSMYKTILNNAISKLSMYEKNDVMDFYLGENRVESSNTIDLFNEFLDEYENYDEEDNDHHNCSHHNHSHHCGCNCFSDEEDDIL